MTVRCDITGSSRTIDDFIKIDGGVTTFLSHGSKVAQANSVPVDSDGVRFICSITD